MNNRNTLHEIADYYGYEIQANQCIEEMGELIQAIQKERRARGLGYPTDKTHEECLNNLVEEIADVQITLWELQILLRADVTPVIEQKIERQLKRMNK